MVYVCLSSLVGGTVVAVLRFFGNMVFLLGCFCCVDVGSGVCPGVSVAIALLVK